MKKEDFLNKLRKNTHVQYDMPDMKIDGIQYVDILQQFIEMTKAVGGHVIEASKDDDPNDLVRMAYPDAEVFATNLPEIELSKLVNNAAGKCNPDKVKLRNPDTVAEANGLNGTDVGIVRGQIGVIYKYTCTYIEKFINCGRCNYHSCTRNCFPIDSNSHRDSFSCSSIRNSYISSKSNSKSCPTLTSYTM